MTRDILGLLVLTVPFIPLIYAVDPNIHCVQDAVDGPKTTGNLACYDSDGVILTCDACLNGADGLGPSRASYGHKCYITVGDRDPSSIGDPTSCPGDPFPETNPDGTKGADLNPTDGILDGYCAVAGGGGLFGWGTWAACYAYGYSQNQGTDPTGAVGGANLICDTLFAGLCTFFESGAGDVGNGGG